MIAEGQEDTPVTYNLHIERLMITPMPGDQEVGGTFRVSGSVQTGQPTPSLLADKEFHLQLADGTRIDVFVKHTKIDSRTFVLDSSTFVLGITDASDLVRRYEDNDC
jgi:hypothetical protein